MKPSRKTLILGKAFLAGVLASFTPNDLPAQQPDALPAPRKAELAPPGLSLSDLIHMTEQRNPRLSQASFAIDAASGRALQAGLYPNPTVSANFDELGDKTGPKGVNTLPLVSQEIVVGGKLKLSRAAAAREVDQTTLALMTERYGRFTAVRQNFFEVLTLQRRLSIYARLLDLAEKSVKTTQKLLDAKQVSRLDLVQLEVELERYRAEEQSTRRELPAAFRRLAASVGVQDLPATTVLGSLDIPVPEYDLESARSFVVESHPEVRGARAGVERAELLLQRARVEPIPNVTVGAGYVRQNQNKSDDWVIGVSVPVPLWNRNQGNIAAAQAQVGEAIQAIGRAENELVERLATAFGTYSSARLRAERYRELILPKARESYELSLKAYQGGQFEYLRVLESQRVLGQSDLEYNRILGELWRGASEIAGLMLQDEWPTTQVSPKAPCPEPR